MSLQDQVTGLIQQNSFMTNLLSSISHELRTPLSGIMSQLQCLLEIKEISSRMKRDYLHPIFGCARLLTSLIDDIVDYVADRTPTGITLDIEELNIVDVVKDMKKLFDFPARLKNLEIRIDASEDLEETIYNDKRRIIQVLS